MGTRRATRPTCTLRRARNASSARPHVGGGLEHTDERGTPLRGQGQRGAGMYRL